MCVSGYKSRCLTSPVTWQTVTPVFWEQFSPFFMPLLFTLVPHQICGFIIQSRGFLGLTLLVWTHTFTCIRHSPSPVLSTLTWPGSSPTRPCFCRLWDAGKCLCDSLILRWVAQCPISIKGNCVYKHFRHSALRDFIVGVISSLKWWRVCWIRLQFMWGTVFIYIWLM